MPVAEERLEAFVNEYVAIALSFLGEADKVKGPAPKRPARRQDMAEAAVQWVREECEAFLNRDDVQQVIKDWEIELFTRAAIDFYLTRNRHGAGFWDGGWRDAAAKVLTAASHQAGSGELYLGDDGKIYAT